MAAEMLSQLLRPFAERAHCQDSPLRLPSPSSSVASSSVPVSGSSDDKVTTPSSSTSVTVTETLVVVSTTGSASVLPSASLPSCSVTVIR